MPIYQVYCLDVEGRNVEIKEMDAGSDNEAILMAQSLKGLRQCEIWQGHRLIAGVSKFAN